ncbi:leucine-rich repeat and immunoglobulin-like domain-containing nogo receptor-interacting protein 3 [Lineus longissimus]|uniref:leucine-rich repeat and immunoglobulin-like domain-containing nogo receptor-interacting protein 3 n=1 Tax=Lineus longissimus TaxID=88925 RepID=UPI00315DD98B
MALYTNGHISQILLTILLLTQIKDGCTCPKNCMCYEENKVKTVVCIEHIQNGGMNDSQLRATINDISSETDSLHFMGVDVAVLGNNTFDPLSSLRELSFINSRVVELQSDTFAGLVNLQVLSLSGNRITTLPKGLFRNLRKLEKIDLHQNRISRLENGMFHGGVSVKDLNLHSNKLVIGNDSFHGLPNLEMLTLQNTSLKEIHQGALLGLNKLKHLEISDNKGLHIHPETFKHLSNLAFLGLRGIGLRDDFRGNILNGLLSLTKLDVSFNKLDKIPKPANAHKLETLIMTENNMKFIPKNSFKDFKNLKEIHLDFCNVTSIHDQAFYGLSNLKILKLDHNRLISVSPAILGSLTSATVSLIGNLWSCDCRMYHTKHWIHQSKRNVDIICDSPLELLGRSLQSLPPDVPDCRAPVIKDCCHDSYIVKQGADITVNCTATGVPAPETKFSVTSPGMGKSSQSLNTLTLTNVQTGGNFSCTATNVVGVSRKYFLIQVISSDCGPDPRVIVIFVTILLVISALILFVVIYVTKYKRGKKHFVKIDKTDKDISGLMEHTNGAYDL